MKYPFAVFVSSVTKHTECVKEIKDKIALNKQYGLKELNIHGIGAENVQKIREIVTELESQHDTEINMTGHTIIHVKVNL